MTTRLQLTRAAGRPALLVGLAAGVAVYDTTVLLLTAPWLLAVLWAVTRSDSVLRRDSIPPSMADDARRRLAVR